MKELETLTGGNTTATVKLVAIGGHKYVLKTDTLKAIAAQHFFNDQLAAHNIPTLAVRQHIELPANQLLLEYIPDSLTVGRELTPENCRLWGETVRKMHTVTFDQFFVLDDQGQRVNTSWDKYLDDYIDAALTRARQSDLDPQTLDRAEVILRHKPDYKPGSFSLVHGDLHVHNALLRDQSVILYDKDDDTMVAPAVFDLAVIYAENFPGGLYPELDKPDGRDQKFLPAFLTGYGQLPADQARHLPYFMLLRALYRYPNPFFSRLQSVIRRLVRAEQ